MEIWLRRWALRRLYGPCERTSDAILRNNHARYARKGSHNDRGPREERIASRSEGLDANQRAAMRLLPGGTDDASGGIAKQQKEADRSGNRSVAVRQHLPLRNISSN